MDVKEQIPPPSPAYRQAGVLRVRKKSIFMVRGWCTAIEYYGKGNHLVIAPGGGAVLDADNVKTLRRNGFIIWLKADSQTLLKRIQKDQGSSTRRPTLTGKGALEEIEETISERGTVSNGVNGKI